MKFPAATVLLAVALVGIYLHLSGGLLYIDQPTLESLALNGAHSPFGFFSYMFVHVGVVHLAGNLLPLLIFALILELSIAAAEVIAVFVFAGIISSVLFSLLNPSVALVGASAGVSGLIGAAVSVKPKFALPALLLAPFLFTFLVLPVVDSLSFQQQQAVFQQANELNRQFDQFASQNRTDEAVAVNQKLAKVSGQKKVLEEGAKRDASTPSDFFVHVVGVVFGVAYVFVARRGVFEKGAHEFLEFLRSLPFANALNGKTGKSTRALPPAPKTISRKKPSPRGGGKSLQRGAKRAFKRPSKA